MVHDHIIGVGLLTQADLNLLGQQFSRVWPVTDAPGFGELLEAIDQADRELRLDRPD